MTLPPKTVHDGLENPARRRVVLSAGLIAAAGALLPWSKMAYAASPAQASPAELQGFLDLSCLLTAKPQLDSAIATRIFVALSDGDRGFGPKVQSLIDALKKAGVQQMSQYKGSAVEADKDQQALVLLIVSAWYLGHTGTSPGLTTVDDTRFITYTDALMFKPTIDATVIPTYARAGTNYWSQPPSTIATD